VIIGNTLQLTETVAPTSEPVALADMKAHLRVDTADDDTLITALIKAARQYVEGVTGRALVDRTYRLDLPRFSSVMRLPKPPLIAVSQIQYYDEDNSIQTWAASNYEVDEPAERVLLSDTGTFPNIYNRHDAVQITYTVGYGTDLSPVQAIPEPILVAIKLLVGDYYENREGRIIIPAQLTSINNDTLDRLLWAYRV
jgi:uncharacterized phiE125 gp8 family phage protein